MKPKPKPMYKRNLILALCAYCGAPNYVDGHGNEGRCGKCKAETPHVSVPMDRRDASGTVFKG